MTTFLALTTLGIVVGCIYGLTATGLVVTYTTSGIFNFAHGAIGMMGAFTYWQLSVAWGGRSGCPSWRCCSSGRRCSAPWWSAS